MTRNFLKIALSLCITCLAFTSTPMQTKAATSNTLSASSKYYTKNSSGQYVFKPQNSASNNAKALKALLNNNAKKTIVIPSDSTVEINSAIYIGSNTTLIATGATIVQVENTKGCIRNAPDSSETEIKYNTLENVVIKGGIWKNAVNTGVHSLFRISHARNVTIQDADIRTNFKSHGIEFIACQECVVKNCAVKAYKSETSTQSSVEDAIQIDVASPKTAPGVLSEAGNFSSANGNNTSKYVAGQTCRNITISGCDIRGSRGVCANYCTADNGAWKKYYHRDITIKNCTISAWSSEGIALFNTAGFTVKGNKIIAKGTRNNCYTDGLHVVNMATSKTIAKKENLIYKNKIYGRYNGLAMNSQTSRKIGPTKVKYNTIYCKRGKSACLNVNKSKFVKITYSGNKLKNWK